MQSYLTYETQSVSYDAYCSISTYISRYTMSGEASRACNWKKLNVLETACLRDQGMINFGI